MQGKNAWRRGVGYLLRGGDGTYDPRARLFGHRTGSLMDDRRLAVKLGDDQLSLKERRPYYDTLKPRGDDFRHLTTEYEMSVRGESAKALAKKAKMILAEQVVSYEKRASALEGLARAARAIVNARKVDDGEIVKLERAAAEARRQAEASKRIFKERYAEDSASVWFLVNTCFKYGFFC